MCIHVQLLPGFVFGRGIFKLFSKFVATGSFFLIFFLKSLLTRIYSSNSFFNSFMLSMAFFYVFQFSVYFYLLSDSSCRSYSASFSTFSFCFNCDFSFMTCLCNSTTFCAASFIYSLEVSQGFNWFFRWRFLSLCLLWFISFYLDVLLSVGFF